MRVGDGGWKAARVGGDLKGVRDRLKSGEATLGCSVTLASANVAELIASVGLDWLVLECDHYGVDSADVQQLLMATARSETVSLVRTPPQDLNAIGKALDLGADGVVVPMVTGLDEAQAVVSAARYPPVGTRGFGPMRASTYYLDDERYFHETASSLLVVLILETRGAVEDLERLADAGVDGVIIGPCDLSLAYGLDPLKFNPQIEEICKLALDVGRRTGLAVGINVSSSEDLARRHAQGFTLLDIGPDLNFLHSGLRKLIEAFGAL